MAPDAGSPFTRTCPRSSATAASWPVSGAAPASRNSARVRSRSETAKVLGIQTAQVLLELFGVHALRGRLLALRLDRRAGGLVLGDLDRCALEQLVLGEDARLHAQRDRDRIRRPGVHRDDLAVAVDDQLRVVRVLLDAGDDHLAEDPAEAAQARDD